MDLSLRPYFPGSGLYPASYPIVAALSMEICQPELEADLFSIRYLRIYGTLL
jgi:hypothetical protein